MNNGMKCQCSGAQIRFGYIPNCLVFSKEEELDHTDIRNCGIRLRGLIFIALQPIDSCPWAEALK